MGLHSIYEKFLECGKVSTDTRRIEPGALFFALKGPNFNANQFAREALDKGAAYAVIDEEQYKADERFIVVNDALATLQDLARHHRRQFKIPVLGINGTNGKTTTKELLYAVLSQRYKVLATSGNLNNHIGLPLTLLRLDKSYQMAVIELGASKIGDITELCRIAEPTHGLTTNIGKAHMEGFGGYEGAIRGESEQYDYMLETGGKVFVNSQNEMLYNISKQFKEPYFYPAPGDYFTCTLLSADPYILYRHENGEEVQTQLIGTYNFENVAAALCIGKFFEVPAAAANQAVSRYKPENKRSQIVEKGSNTIILDAYNANPDSMQAALRNLEAMKSPRKAVLLGDMYELGADSPQEHEAIGKLLTQCHFQHIFFCGSLMRDAYRACPQAHYFEDKQALEGYLSAHPLSDTTILLKGSRGMALETILALL